MTAEENILFELFQNTRCHFLWHVKQHDENIWSIERIRNDILYDDLMDEAEKTMGVSENSDKDLQHPKLERLFKEKGKKKPPWFYSFKRGFLLVCASSLCNLPQKKNNRNSNLITHEIPPGIYTMIDLFHARETFEFQMAYDDLIRETNLVVGSPSWALMFDDKSFFQNSNKRYLSSEQ